MNSLKAFIFGATVAIVVGPITLLIINRALNEGIISGLASGFGAALADFVFAIIAFFTGSALFTLLSTYETVLRSVSSLVLIVFGVWILSRAFSKQLPSKSEEKIKVHHKVLSVFFLTLSNPLTIIIFMGLLGQIGKMNGVMSTLLLAFYAFLGSLFVQSCFASLGAIARKTVLNPQFIKGLNILSGLGILLFGVTGIFSSFSK